ncbi:MAG: response regulator transcription factor [Clostridia bacterium]
MAKILIADDDKNICDLLKLYMDYEGFDAIFAHDGSTAIDLANNSNPDVMILDIMLPIINGWEVCKMIRRNKRIPIIMLTARDSLEDKLEGLEIGADDYVVKPFDPKEVIARVRVQLRRKDKEIHSLVKEDIFAVDGLEINLTKYEVRVNEYLVELTPKEVQLLYYLVKNKNIVFERQKLLAEVWGYDYMGETRTVDVHIKRLREKIHSDNAKWDIKTIWGVGYKFEVR